MNFALGNRILAAVIELNVCEETGTQLAPNRKRAFGVRAHACLAEEFLAMLTDKGPSRPEEPMVETTALAKEIIATAPPFDKNE